MSTIITQPGRQAHAEPHPDKAARRRQDRLAKASVEDMKSALAFLSIIDPEAFEIAFTAVAPRAHEIGEIAEIAEDGERIPVCRECGALVGIFLAMACGGSTTVGTASRPGPKRSTTPVIPQKSPGLFPRSTRKSSSQRASGQCPVGQPDGARGALVQPTRPLVTAR
ncbi:MAG: hypothetical protein ABSA02_25505 [Trebonia sp.]|jgi:hypothetical protein